MAAADLPPWIRAFFAPVSDGTNVYPPSGLVVFPGATIVYDAANNKVTIGDPVGVTNTDDASFGADETSRVLSVHRTHTTTNSEIDPSELVLYEIDVPAGWTYDLIGTLLIRDPASAAKYYVDLRCTVTNDLPVVCTEDRSTQTSEGGSGSLAPSAQIYGLAAKSGGHSIQVVYGYDEIAGLVVDFVGQIQRCGAAP